MGRIRHKAAAEAAATITRSGEGLRGAAALDDEAAEEGDDRSAPRKDDAAPLALFHPLAFILCVCVGCVRRVSDWRAQ